MSTVVKSLFETVWARAIMVPKERRARGRAIGRVGLLGLGLVLAGCAGYRNDSLFPEGTRRIAVPVFDNETFFRQIELDLTRSVCDEIRSRPGVYLVDESQADVILQGTITDVEQRVLSITRRERPTESSATTEVRCRVVDAETGRLMKEFSERERVDFALAAGEGLLTAQREAFYELARKIVFQLEADW